MNKKKMFEKMEAMIDGFINGSIEFGIIVLLFYLPFSTGAYLYGVLDHSSSFQIPLVILSVIIFSFMIKKFEKEEKHE